MRWHINKKGFPHIERVMHPKPSVELYDSLCVVGFKTRQLLHSLKMLYLCTLEAIGAT
jgi:hypothetical protein